jgi:hypothetical protein
MAAVYRGGMNGTGTKTMTHSRGVRLEVVRVDGTETVIAAWAVDDREGVYRVEVDGEARGCVEVDGTGRWRAYASGEGEPHPLRALGAHHLDQAAREAAEHFTGRRMR